MAAKERGIRFANSPRINYNWESPAAPSTGTQIFPLFCHLPNTLDEWGQRGSVTLRRAQ